MINSYIENLTRAYDAANLDSAFDKFAKSIEGYGDDRVIIEYEITPALAAVLLRNFNPDNRNISTNHVDKLADDMANGRFDADNGQTIVLCKDGKVNDGQHRLCAIVKANKAAVIGLALNRDRDSRFTLDTGAKRTTGHVLSLLGMSYGNTVAAASRRVLAYRDVKNPTAGSRVSDNRVFQFASEDELIKEVSQWAQSNLHAFKPFRLPASEIATCFYLFSEKHPAEAKMFFNTLKEGLGLSKGNPIYTLRQKLMTNPNLSVGLRFELLIRAWNFWIRNEEIQKFQLMGRIPEVLGKKDMSKSRAKDKSEEPASA